MFERLVLRFSDEENYRDLLLLSFGVTVLSVLLVQHVVEFRVGSSNLSGLLAVLFTSLAVSYPFVTYMLREEREEAQNRLAEKTLLKRHARQMELYVAFFLGTTLAFAFTTFFVPETFYALQAEVLRSLGVPTGRIISTGFFVQILQNNIWVLAVTFVLTFFLSSGIIFVLAWNASVLGVLIGNLSRSIFEVPIYTLFYLPHGLLEIGGYVLAGLAGALLSYHTEILMFDEDAEEGITRRINMDVAFLMIAAVAFVVLGALVEAL